MRLLRLALAITALATSGCGAESASAFTATFASARAAYLGEGYECSEPGGDNERVPFSVTHCQKRNERPDLGIILYGMADGMVGGVDIVPAQRPLEWSALEPLVVETLRPLVSSDRLDSITEVIGDRLADASFDQPVAIGSGLQLRRDATSIYLWTPELAAEADAVLASPD